MKFPQIFMLLALLGMLAFSCRETQIKKGNNPNQENSIPSAEKHQEPRFDPKKANPKPQELSRDSILKKQKKSKDLDTLKPKVAML